MSDTVRELLTATAFRPVDVEEMLDPERPSFVRFDPELGYVPSDIIMRDGMDFSFSAYTYEPGGQRGMVNYRGLPCRINTYGDSFTQCQQVSDGETWQEYLAAHIGEPIRNFGCGGYSMYAACRRALRVERTDVGVEFVILNIWEDDHVRNLDSARWIRTHWPVRDKPADRTWPHHGLPWAHVRFDPDRGQFVGLPGVCRTEQDLRDLTDPDHFYEVFKDDAIVRLYALMIGGEAEVADLEAVADALGINVNLRDPATRQDDARRLHLAYGLKSTEYVLDIMRPWLEDRGKKLMVLLSYGGGAVLKFAKDGSRFDQSIVDYLERNNVTYVDHLTMHAEDRRMFGGTDDDYVGRYYIHAAGAAVFGHYNPTGNHFFAFSIKNDVVDWLDPKPPAYTQQEAIWSQVSDDD